MSYIKSHLFSGNGKQSMRSGSLIALVFFLVGFGGILSLNTVFAGALPVLSYEHTPPNGLISNQRTTVELLVDSVEEIQDVRLYFRPFFANDYVFIELSPDNDGHYSGELPAFDEVVRRVEYLFLWKTGSRQIVRTTPYVLLPIESGSLSQLTGVPITVFTELDGKTDEELNDFIEDTFVVENVPENLRHGMQTGLFDMRDDKRYRYGYFGGFLHEPDKNVTYAIEGYVNFMPISGSKDLIQPFLSQTPEGYPNVAGDDWAGLFYRTDSSSRTHITAAITQNGYGGVAVTTSLSGHGHYLTGSISSGSSGSLYLIDHWDGKIWTTHSLAKSTSVYFGFEDYIYTPSPSNPDPPLYRIELTRPEPKEPINWLPPILELLILE